MNPALSSRLGRVPAGGIYTPSSVATMPGGPTSMQGGINISGTAGTNGAGGVGGVLLVMLAGLGVFYFATRSIQGLR